jgi:hypothetical protein
MSLKRLPAAQLMLDFVQQSAQALQLHRLGQLRCRRKSSDTFLFATSGTS